MGNIWWGESIWVFFHFQIIWESRFDLRKFWVWNWFCFGPVFRLFKGINEFTWVLMVFFLGIFGLKNGWKWIFKFEIPLAWFIGGPQVAELWGCRWLSFATIYIKTIKGWMTPYLPFVIRRNKQGLARGPSLLGLAHELGPCVLFFYYLMHF